MNGFSSVGVEGPNNRRFTHNAPAGPPCVPSNFHVEKIIGNSSLKLSWQPVTIDSNGCSNGVKVTGYRVSKLFVHGYFDRREEIVITWHPVWELYNTMYENR